MKVIKKINNNVAVCLDNNHQELIAFGKGIGFPKMPYELNDLSLIQRTYYGVEIKFWDLLKDIPEVMFRISTRIVDLAKNKIDYEINSNFVFTLADHINFAIERFKKNIPIKTPFSYDIQYFYTTEVELGEMALEVIEKEINARLPKDEVYNIALHFINAKANAKVSNEGNQFEEILDDLTKIVEENFSLTINKEGFNYSRFVSHLQYLLKRGEKKIDISSENNKLLNSISNEFPGAYTCALNMKDYLNKKLSLSINEEEILYLMLHLNRLCAREDLNH
jgi:beta-glucoside operon transcriptional antiterminator